MQRALLHENTLLSVFGRNRTPENEFHGVCRRNNVFHTLCVVLLRKTFDCIVFPPFFFARIDFPFFFRSYHVKRVEKKREGRLSMCAIIVCRSKLTNSQPAKMHVNIIDEFI